MGFDWDKYQGGGNYISAAEKKVLAENGIPFVISGVSVKEKFEGEHYELAVRVPDPETGDDEDRTLSFPIGTGAESRDSMLAGLKKYLEENEGEEVRAKVTKIGRAFFLEQA